MCANDVPSIYRTPSIPRGWLGPDLRKGLARSHRPGESTVASVADRLGLNPKTVRRNLDKLETNRLVRSSEGRPAQYRADPTVDSDHLDRVADAYGVLDWEAKASERFTRERAGYAEALRQRYEQASA